jgi:ABC-type transport system involved in multi-copper enzyme maturation permease subunit
MFDNSPWAVVTAEWTKIRSLRSTVFALALVLVVSVGIGVLDGASARSAIASRNPALRPDFDPVNAGFVGTQYGQLCLVAFGVLLMCSEYTSGMIRASLSAVAQRGLFYAGKIAACAGVTFLLSCVTAFISFLATQQALGPYGVSISDGEALRAVLGAPLYLTLICLLSVGVGTMLRGTALSLTVMFAFIFVLSPVANNISGLREAARYLPDYAGSQVMKVGAQADAVIGPWTGLFILLAWTTAALAGGYVALRRRDA